MGTINPALRLVLDFRVNGMRPFDTEPADLASTSLSQAHALATMLGAAFAESQDTASTNPEIVRAAFDGIARLVALAALAGECA